MRRSHPNSQELRMSFDTMEFPRVAHIVADLDDMEQEQELTVVPRDSRAREVFQSRPALRHTVFARSLGAAAIMLALGACASTGATFRSGVGDAFPEQPPYYAGASSADVSRQLGKVGHLPIMFQRGATQAPVFEPESGKGTELAALLDEMNAYLDALKVSVAIADARTSFSTAAVAPDVQFGCMPEGNLPGNDCADRGDVALGRGRQTMRLAVGRPSEAWVTQNLELMRKSGATQTLVITLELGQYLVKQSGLKGSKSVELGSGYTESLPWLTSLETPVTVLQLTGALVDNAGKAIRIGAEGIAAQRTRLLVSAVGGQELFGDEAVKRARTARREDLRGTPLAWEVALRSLVTELTGQQP
jgi:hypothetical protein